MSKYSELFISWLTILMSHAKLRLFLGAEWLSLIHTHQVPIKRWSKLRFRNPFIHARQSPKIRPFINLLVPWGIAVTDKQSALIILLSLESRIFALSDHVAKLAALRSITCTHHAPQLATLRVSICATRS